MQMVFFDIDGTLLTEPSSERRFCWWLLRAGRLGPRQLFCAAWFLLRHWHRYGRHVFKKNKAYLAGLEVAEIHRCAEEWVNSELASAWYRPCLRRLREHQDAGDRVILLSGTPDFLAGAIARRFGVDEFIGSRCATADGRFLARPPIRHPFAGEKAEIAKARCAEAGIGSAEVVAYGDSGHDMALLGWAGQAVAVRPDSALRAAAAGRGWEIMGQRRETAAGVTPLSAPRP